MSKLCKKLVVYLDQNFIGEMAKAPTNERVNPQSTAVYELLHRGFIDEKLVVPMSPFHDLETSLALKLQERFRNYQGYLGQISLRLRSEIETTAVDRALSSFLGEQLDPLDYQIGFSKDPDQRLEQFTVRVNMGYGDLGLDAERRETREGLERARKAALASGRTYRDQVQTEIQMHAPATYSPCPHGFSADAPTPRSSRPSFVPSISVASPPSASSLGCGPSSSSTSRPGRSRRVMTPT